MKMFLIIKLLVLCHISQSSLAVERKSSAALEKLSEAFQYFDIMSSEFLDTYLIEEVFVKRYTQRQLNDTSELKEAMLGSLFPGKNDSQIDESYCRSKLEQEKSSSERNFTSQFNGHLVKVDEAWKMRKVESGEVTYSNVEGGNVMELIEFLFVFGFNRGSSAQYHANKILALIQIKYQLEEDFKETGRSMFEFEEDFWRENNLRSDLIQEVLNLNSLVHEFGERNEADEVFMGVSGEKSIAVDQVEREVFGNMTFAELFESYLDNLFNSLELGVESLNQKAFKDDIKITTANDYLEENAKNENEENVDGENTEPKKHRNNKEKHQKMKQKLSKEQIERIKILPMKFSKKKLPCNAHLRKALKKNKESYKYWKPFCNPDGSYKTTEKICRKRQCWCINNKGMFLKQIFKASDAC